MLDGIIWTNVMIERVGGDPFRPNHCSRGNANKRHCCHFMAAIDCNMGVQERENSERRQREKASPSLILLGMNHQEVKKREWRVVK